MVLYKVRLMMNLKKFVAIKTVQLQVNPYVVNLLLQEAISQVYLNESWTMRSKNLSLKKILKAQKPLYQSYRVNQRLAFI